MNETITLGVDGDINLIKNKILTNPEYVFPVSISKRNAEEKTTYLVLDFSGDINMLDKYLNLISEYIIERYEIRFLKRILDETYPYLSQAQRREILKNKENYCDDKDVGYSVRKRCVYTSLCDCLREEKTILLEGFVAFRLRDYEILLEILVENLINDYTTKKEYDEFIELLRYFVKIQYPRPEKINILVKPDSGYTILDESGRDITEKCVQEFSECIFPLTDSDYDDVLISILITAAPKTVIVHGKNNIKNSELFNTVNRVFENVTYCEECTLCAVNEKKHVIKK